jgi:hypothetical protein
MPLRSRPSGITTRCFHAFAYFDPAPRLARPRRLQTALKFNDDKTVTAVAEPVRRNGGSAMVVTEKKQ